MGCGCKKKTSVSEQSGVPTNKTIGDNKLLDKAFKLLGRLLLFSVIFGLFPLIVVFLIYVMFKHFVLNDAIDVGTLVGKTKELLTNHNEIDEYQEPTEEDFGIVGLDNPVILNKQ